MELKGMMTVQNGLPLGQTFRTSPIILESSLLFYLPLECSYPLGSTEWILTTCHKPSAQTTCTKLETKLFVSWWPMHCGFCLHLDKDPHVFDDRQHSRRSSCPSLNLELETFGTSRDIRNSSLHILADSKAGRNGYLESYIDLNADSLEANRLDSELAPI
jgi:hypothetical protein